MEQKTRQHNKKKSLLKELQSYEESGTHLYLEGHPSEAKEIVQACLFAENTDYMRDFISEDGTHISEIHFVKIHKRQE